VYTFSPLSIDALVVGREVSGPEGEPQLIKMMDVAANRNTITIKVFIICKYLLLFDQAE
jgi:hypothetical protein